MSGDVHDGLIASAAFRKVGDERVPVVVPTAFHLGVGAHIVPCRLEGGNGARGVTWTRLSEGKDIPLGAGLSELLPVPNGILGKNLEEGGVQRDGRPSPASVLLRPTARNFFVKSICSQVKFLISASRIPALSASVTRDRCAENEPCGPPPASCPFPLAYRLFRLFDEPSA